MRDSFRLQLRKDVTYQGGFIVTVFSEVVFTTAVYRFVWMRRGRSDALNPQRHPQQVPKLNTEDILQPTGSHLLIRNQKIVALYNRIDNRHNGD